MLVEVTQVVRGHRAELLEQPGGELHLVRQLLGPLGEQLGKHVAAVGLAGTDAGFAALKSGTSFFRQSYGFYNNLIGYVVGQQMADWFAGLEIASVQQGRCIPVLSPAAVDDFKKFTADPAASYKKLIAGDYDSLGLALWGQINYDTRMSYTANAVT